MTLHIGIAAVSSEGAALCYRTICAEAPALLGPRAHPEVTLHAPPLAAYVERLDRGDWPGVGELLLVSAAKLAAAGADFLICPDNTVHAAMKFVLPRSALPWLHIAEVVAAEAGARGYRRVGLTGTRWLVESSVYPEKLSALGIACERPTAEERLELNRVIMEELVAGTFKPASTAFIQRVIARMRESGCEAVVLGCTEIPLVIGEANSPLPVLDSTRALARAALRRAAGAADTRASPASF